MSTGIDDLPAEVLEYVLGLLYPYQDLENCKCVSRRWYNLVQSEFLEDFPCLFPF